MHAKASSINSQKHISASKQWVLVLIALAVALSLCAIASAPEAAYAQSKNSKACAAYRKALSKKTITWGFDRKTSTRNLQFACQDINKDGIKDLVVYNPDAYHSEGWYRIYTYSKGKVKSLGSFTAIEVYRNKNFFRDTYMNRGHSYTTYYRLQKNGKAKKLAYYETNQGFLPDQFKRKAHKKRSMGEIPLYYFNFKVNGKAVSYSKCMKTVKSLEKKAKQTLKYHDNTVANRKKYLK